MSYFTGILFIAVSSGISFPAILLVSKIIDMLSILGRPLMNSYSLYILPDSYVGYISGTCLAQIYKDEGQKLIEKNVRSFLQAHGKVNRGIRDTLKSNSQMFMAYNNGISTTAEDIVIDESNVHSGLVTIKEIHGWQIVNGGQTTASVYTAMQAKIPLDDVFIQIKLTVIKNKEKTDEIISSISKYANSQNKITMSDFSANDDFHIEFPKRLPQSVQCVGCSILI